MTWHLVEAQSSLPAGHQGPLLVHPRLQRRPLRPTHIQFGFSFDTLEGLKFILCGGEGTPLWLLLGDTLSPAWERPDPLSLLTHRGPGTLRWNRTRPPHATPSHGSHGELAAAAVTHRAGPCRVASASHLWSPLWADPATGSPELEAGHPGNTAPLEKTHPPLEDTSPHTHGEKAPNHSGWGGRTRPVGWQSSGWGEVPGRP